MHSFVSSQCGLSCATNQGAGTMVMERLRKYGPTAVGTYLCLSACTWTCFFIALENHMDVNGLLKRIGGEGWDKKEVLKKWGLKPADPDKPSVWDEAPSAVLALIASKALVPIKVPIALGMTPYVRRALAAQGLLKG